MTSQTRTFLESGFQPGNLVDVLRWRAINQPDRLAYTFLTDNETEEARLTYQQLDQRSQAIAAWLQSVSKAGERALILYPPGLDYIAGFFGCLYAGVVAVPVYPPRRNRNLERILAIAESAQPTVLLTTSPTFSAVQSFFGEHEKLKSVRCVDTGDLVNGTNDSWREPAIGPGTLAFLQYTSGSTGRPKGVMLSHGNLLHNSTLLRQAFEYDSNSHCVSWLPIYHDMGLIGGVLQPLFGGYPCTLMAPASFLRSPVSWLRAISRRQGVISGGPNFAYRLCVDKISAEDRAELDLSGWSVAFNGAEPIHHETLKQFTAAFAPHGFRQKAFYSCYGLAESTLMVSGGLRNAAPVIKTVEPKALECKEWVETSNGAGQSGRTLVSCGKVRADQQVVLVNPDSLVRCGANEVGEIWVSSPSVGEGYWNSPQQTEEIFKAHLSDTGEGPFLRTGDLGVLQDEELFVVGRLKDLIIIRGLNHHPQDIESTVQECSTALRPTCGAAFSIEAGGEERLVVVQEMAHRSDADPQSIIEVIRAEVAEKHNLQIYAVVLTRPRTILKTSSGKIQRSACRTAFLNGELQVISEWRDTETPGTEPQLPLLDSAPASKAVVETWLASHLARQLKVPVQKIDVSLPVIRYGLDSLRAIELMHSIEAKLGVNLSMTTLLQSPSVSELASEIFMQLTAHSVAETQNVPNAYIAPTHTPAAVKYPLSQGQRALWFLNRLAPESSAYNISGALSIKGELNVGALHRALQALVDRHPSLRTSFIASQEQLFQQVRDRETVDFDVEDASTWSQAQLNRRLTGESGCSFSLEMGPLFRVRLFTRSTADYILLLVMHHIISDHWSIAVITRELRHLYQAELANKSSALPSLSLQYSDYVRWESEMLSGPEGERLWSYWQKQLAGELPSLNLPADRIRPAVQTYDGAALQFELSAEMTERLRSLAQSRMATLYMVLMAAFELFLYRHTGQSDLVIGSPTAGRRWAEVTDVVGYFVNPVAIRSDLSRNQTFNQFLDQVRQTVLDAFEHQAYPFPLLVERLQPERSLSREPIFQALFAFDNEPTVPPQLPGVTITSIDIDTQVAQFDLVLRLTDMGHELKGTFEYSTDLFERSTISRMQAHFQILIESLLADPECRLSELAVLSEAERRQLLVEWNDTDRQYASGRCLHELFEAQAALTPDRMAVADQNRQLSYRELNERANQLAHCLQGLKVGPEVLVGIMMERSIEMVVALLGVLKAGGAYVPLDPQYPQERIDFMLADTQAPLVLTEQHLADRMWNKSSEILCLDSSQVMIAENSRENPVATARENNLAYVIYTSGSSGRPKGITLQHHSPVVLAAWAREVFEPSDLSGVLASTSICFDLSIFELFVPLSCGGSVILASDALQLPSLWNRESVTLINTVPSAMSELVRTRAIPASVRTVNLAGEALANGLVQQVYQQGVKRVYNLYGPSEDTTYSTSALIAKGSDGTPSIGRPIANTQVYLLDQYLEPVPRGVAGELYIGGAGLARDYLNQPALTAARFVPDPYGNVAGARLYRTGDLGRHHENGEIEYLGRMDEQVKVRGYRIELGEIETVLEQHEAVHEAVVNVYDEAGQKRLVAYVVAEKQTNPGVSELRMFLQERLPSYMVPAAIVFLEQWPLTPNGKLNRKALPAPDDHRPALDTQFVAPRTELERVLTDFWMELLNRRQVGVNDNFFELGGDSIRAALFINRLQEEFGEVIQVRSIFDKPEVAALALYLEQHHPHGVAKLLGAGLSLGAETNSGVIPEAYSELPAIEPIFQESNADHALFQVKHLSDEVDLMAETALS
jgi:amino acid adenylation domain-containing protein